MNRSKILKVTRNGMCRAALLTATCCFAQTDPGPRGGAPGAGSPLGRLTPGELDFFNNHGVPQFIQVEGVADGLGPRFNLSSCGGFHIPPPPGGRRPPPKPPPPPPPTHAPRKPAPSFLPPPPPPPHAPLLTTPHR